MSIQDRMADFVVDFEHECCFEIACEDHEFWALAAELIEESGVDPSLVVSVCKQPDRAANGNPMIGFTVFGEATARKLVCHCLDLDDDDEDVSRYYN